MTFNFLKGVGNQHLDVARMLWAASGIAAIVLTSVHLVRDSVFSIIEFGTGMAAILAAGSGAVAIKDTAVAKANATTATSERD